MRFVSQTKPVGDVDDEWDGRMGNVRLNFRLSQFVDLAISLFYFYFVFGVIFVHTFHTSFVNRLLTDEAVSNRDES